MIKHIGKHNERKVVILYHMVPNEDHMCLVSYSDLLPRMIHDEIMRALESASGQQSANLSDLLFRTMMADGRNVLEVLHKEGFMKKVPTSQVIMTPTASAKIRLDELNSLLAEMATGADAVKRMAEIDAQAGLQTKKRDNTPKKPGATLPPAPALQAAPNEVLSDEVIAAQHVAQAARMRAEASSMLAEADRLEKDAQSLTPAPVVKAKKTVKSTPTMKATNDTTKETKKVKV